MMRLARLVLAISFLLGPALRAQPAYLVKDLSPGLDSPGWPHETEWVTLGSLAVFTRYDTVHGLEIWKSDGTDAGTAPILDVCPGSCSSSPRALTVVGGVVFFGASDGAHGHSLWKTDGTAAGTTLIREVAPSSYRGVLGSLFLFAHGAKLWRSDGTRAGTYSLGGSNPWPLGEAGGLLLFAAEHPVHGRGLWKTDGTVDGTAFLLSLPSLEGPAFPYPTVGGRLFFLRGDELWVSDGTVAGTYKVSGASVWGNMAGLGDEVFFSGQDAQGLELWKSDGTPAGTVRVKDLNPSGSSDPREIVAVGDRLFFRTSAPSRLWTSDGTEAGTVPVATLAFQEYCNGFLPLGDKLLFFASADGSGREPWVSDGTGAGTLLLSDVHPGAGSSFDSGGWYGPDGWPLSQMDGGTVAGGQWIFRALTPNGWEIWKSDGTPAGTGLVESVVDGTGQSGVFPFFADLDGTLIFSGPANLWRSNGSEPGTSQIDGFPHPPADLTRLGDHVYLTSTAAGRLWRTDGAMVEGIDMDTGYWTSNLVAAGSNLFYISTSMNGYDERIRRADGTSVADILITSTWTLGNLTAAGTNLYFARRTTDGEEIWKSGGAPNDAVLLQTFPYLWPRQLGSFGGFGNSLFFAANDGATGQELWFTDGTVSGTRRVKDIAPGARSSNPRSFVQAGNLVFFVADDGINGTELWRSDGTGAGTFRITKTSYIQGLTAFGNMVVFSADDGVNGVELWGSYGYAGSAFLIKDIRPGAGSSFPGGFRVVGHTILFAADDGTHGLEPWRTDGFPAGTFLVQDILAGPEPSSPAGFTLSGDYLFFTATDRTHGFELWALDRAALGSTLDGIKRIRR